MNPTRRKLSELSRDEVDSLYRKIFNDADGQLVLEDIKEAGFCYQTTARSGGPNDLGELDIEMKCREGMRIMALLIEKRSTEPYNPKPNQEEEIA